MCSLSKASCCTSGRMIHSFPRCARGDHRPVDAGGVVPAGVVRGVRCGGVSPPRRRGRRLPGREGIYLAAPVEYKRGKDKQDQCDEAQLCAQAMCLEEMLSVHIPSGICIMAKSAIGSKSRSDERAARIWYKMAEEMHGYFERGYTPRVKPSKACRSCSLKDICLPVCTTKRCRHRRYIQDANRW